MPNNHVMCDTCGDIKSIDDMYSHSLCIDCNDDLVVMDEQTDVWLRADSSYEDAITDANYM